MKNKMKQLFGIILSLVLALGLMPGMSMTAKAAEYTSLSVGDVIKVGDSFTPSDNIIEVATGGGNANMLIADYGDYPLTLVRANVVEVTDVEGGTTSTVTESETGGYYVFRYRGNRYVTNTEWVVSGKTDGLVLDSIGTYQYYTRTDPLYTFSVHETTVAVTGVSLDKTTAQAVTVGDKVAFTATVAPNNATDKYVTWSSNSDALKLYADSSCTVALGTTTGVVAGQPIYAKGILLGDATVTATSRSNNDVTASCDVTVISNTYNVTYKVVNGTWSDGSTADKTETVASGGNPASVPTGMLAATGYEGGSWDTDPSTTTITGDTTFTYTFSTDSSSGGASYIGDVSGGSGDSSGGSSNSGSGSSSSGSSDNTNTNTDTSTKVPYNDVAISTGSVKDITGTAAATAESNPFGTKIENNSNLTTLLSLTDAEVAEGVNVWLDIQDMSASVPQTDKTLIQNTSGDYTVGLYLDINLFKKVGSNDATKVTETKGKVKASIVIPESLWKSGRTFEIIRVHNGVATAIEGTYDENTHVFTFETDKFSTYALAYKDQASSSNSGTTSNSSNSIQSTAPKTGDSNDIRVWYLLLIASLGGLGFIGYSKKKEN